MLDKPMTPEEIVEYIHQEHTPYSNMSFEDGKTHLAELIQKYADWYSINPGSEIKINQVIKDFMSLMPVEKA